MPNSTSTLFLLLFASFGAVWAHDAAAADKKTVCSVTVNSSDEKDTFRRNLPADKYQFVELVERGRTDWLDSACRQGIKCDVLVISGHYDGGNEFYSEHLDSDEFLPVDEMERVSCSDSCSGLFSQLKEVYLFGCNTLNPGARKSASSEIGRSLVRAGYSRVDAERASRGLSAIHGESSRDRMRLIFKDVPVIYGFSAKAPLGPGAAAILSRYFQGGVGGEVGSGRVSAKLLGLFGPSSMTVTNGSTDADPQAGYRQDLCQFSDDRLSTAQKLVFVRQLLNREMAEVRMFLDHIEKYAGSISDAERQEPAVAQALDEIARDKAARTRYLDFARDADEPAIRARMVRLAGSLGWLSPAEQRTEIMQMIGAQIVHDAVSPADVNLVCTLNKDHDLDQEAQRLHVSPTQASKVSDAAVLACLGDAGARAQMLLALTSPNEQEVQIAQIYLRHQPIADVNELRVVASGIARMNGANAQVRALDTLAGQHLSDPESIDELTRLYPRAESVGVQMAIAGVLIRADYKVIDRPELVQTLQQHRLPSPNGADLIDILIRRLQTQ